ncbi:MAG: hypothetical protein ABEJ24_05755 [Candidatus Magasanikbacteria bacterium]
MTLFNKSATIITLLLGLSLIGAGCGASPTSNTTSNQNKEIKKTQKKTKQQNQEGEVVSLSLGETAESSIVNVTIEEVRIPNKYTSGSRTFESSDLRREGHKFFLAKVRMENTSGKDLSSMARPLTIPLAVERANKDKMPLDPIMFKGLKPGESATFWVRPKIGSMEGEATSIVYEFESLTTDTRFPDSVSPSKARWNFDSSEIKRGGSINVSN